MPTEADTCRKFVVPKLQAAGWENDPHSIAEQRSITDGRITIGLSSASKIWSNKSAKLPVSEYSSEKPQEMRSLPLLLQTSEDQSDKASRIVVVPLPPAGECVYD